MAPFRQYVLSLTAAALLGGVLLACVPEGSGRKILRLVCGILLTVTALKPLGQLRLPDLDALSGEYRQQAEAAVAMGQEMARLEAQEGICKALEAYILDKAEVMGVSLEVNIALNENGLPISVRLSGAVPPGAKKRLQSIIETDLGIPKEAQTWSG